MKGNKHAFVWAVAAVLTLLMACTSMPSSTAPVQFSGDTLINKAGMTLYTYDKDTRGKSACIDTCARNWPPFLATAEDKPGGDFTIITRADGSRQWAYEGKPLYLWIKDAKPGDRTGDGVGKVWHTATRARAGGTMGARSGDDY